MRARKIDFRGEDIALSCVFMNRKKWGGGGVKNYAKTHTMMLVIYTGEGAAGGQVVRAMGR